VGWGESLARLLTRLQSLIAAKPFAQYFAGYEFPWEYADAETTAARLRAVGFEQVQTSLEEAPTRFQEPQEFGRFVENVILHQHLERLPQTGLRETFLDELTRQAAGDDPPFLLDYWRLNLKTRRPGD